MKNQLIGVSGKKGSGKDTFFQIIKEIDSDFVNLKFATKLKSICAELTGLPIHYFYERKYYSKYLKEWDMTVRQFMQKLGTESLRKHFHNDVWVKALLSEFYEINQPAVVTDVRFKNEAEAIKDAGGILVRIEPSFESYENDDDQHESEIDLDDYNDWDFVIRNDSGLHTYTKRVNLLYNKIMGK